MAAAESEGVVSIPSRHSVAETMLTLESLLAGKGIRLFAVVDHSGEAAKAGFAMKPTQLLIFGSPQAGTPLMLAAPGIALDLPLKILVWEDAQGKVWLSWNAPEYLRARHSLPENLTPVLAAAEALATAAAQ
jgi:uncharacterized protein (DUF302 family)